MVYFLVIFKLKLHYNIWTYKNQIDKQWLWAVGETTASIGPPTVSQEAKTITLTRIVAERNTSPSMTDKPGAKFVVV